MTRECPCFLKEKNMFVDYHVHTDYSDDSDYPMEEVVKDAIQMGMDEICFTDHVDYGAKWIGTAERRFRTVRDSRW